MMFGKAELAGPFIVIEADHGDPAVGFQCGFDFGSVIDITLSSFVGFSKVRRAYPPLVTCSVLINGCGTLQQLGPYLR